VAEADLEAVDVVDDGDVIHGHKRHQETLAINVYITETRLCRFDNGKNLALGHFRR
jgi:hypothetical protein